MQKALIPNLSAAPFCDTFQAYPDDPNRYPDNVWLIFGSDSDGASWGWIALVYVRYPHKAVEEVGADFTMHPNCPEALRGRIGAGEQTFRDEREALAWVTTCLQDCGVRVYKRGDPNPVERPCA